MKLLAVETSTEACSAALFIDDAVAERFEVAPKDHTRLILPMIDSLMGEAGLKPQQLDGLAFSRGPGSFTGVRIATGVIHGIALGADLPVVPVSTLAAIAQNYFDKNDGNIAFTAMDARMGEIFWGVYQRDADGFAELWGEEVVGCAEHIGFPDACGIGLGSGWAVYQQQLSGRLNWRVESCVVDDVLPRAGAIARLGAHHFQLGRAVAVEQAMPVYLRDKVAKTEFERGKI